MAEKRVRPLGGVGGVLSGLLSGPEAAPQTTVTPPRETMQEDQDVPVVQPVELETPESQEPRKAPATKTGTGEKQKARRGRPPAGTRPSESVEREKVSLRLRADLAATYRDWSWDEHCQFSDLVDRAMEHYLKSRGKARKPEKE